MCMMQLPIVIKGVYRERYFVSDGGWGDEMHAAFAEPELLL